MKDDIDDDRTSAILAAAKGVTRAAALGQAQRLSQPKRQKVLKAYDRFRAAVAAIEKEADTTPETDEEPQT